MLASVSLRRAAALLQLRTLQSSPWLQNTHVIKRTISTPLAGKGDRWNGITVDLQCNENFNKELFSKDLKDSLHLWKTSGKKAIWLNVPIMQSDLIPLAAQQGFKLHHSQGETVTLCKWLPDDLPNRIPIYATHQVGVAGFVLNEDKGEVLMVQDKIRIARWKFPGGLSDPGEDMADTAIREVYEETGIRSEFKSILSFRQQHDHPNAFGNSDIYVVCRLRPLTFDIKMCEEELTDVQWMDVHDLAYKEDMAPITTRICRLVAYGLREGFDKVDIIKEQMASVYKGAFFKIFHRPLPDKYNKRD